MKLEGNVLGFQVIGDVQDRGHADAAGQQHGSLRALGNPETIAGRADLQGVALFDHVVQRFGPAPAVGVPPHADEIAMTFRRTVAQRILAHQSTGNCHIDVGSGRKCRKLRSLGIHQLKRSHVMGLIELFGHDDRAQDVGFHTILSFQCRPRRRSAFKLQNRGRSPMFGVRIVPQRSCESSAVSGWIERLAHLPLSTKRFDPARSIDHCQIPHLGALAHLRRISDIQPLVKLSHQPEIRVLDLERH
jgi:hypothetical protein